MNLGLRANATFLIASSLFLGYGAWAFADDTEPTHQLGLADLAEYRAALAGRATAGGAKSSDTPARVSFKDLWNRPDALRGLRVILEGRVQRIFRQGPVGSFPALAEIWIASPAGDPFCLVIPQDSGTDISPAEDHGLEGRATPERIPRLGQTIRFTGTFLKMIRYTAGDGDRLAPLVVGDQPPVAMREAAKTNRASSFTVDRVGGRWTGSPASWLVGLTLALLAAGVLARLHLRVPMRRSMAARLGRRTDAIGPDPLLEFIDPRDDQ
jgi:hypothetical protein